MDGGGGAAPRWIDCESFCYVPDVSECAASWIQCRKRCAVFEEEPCAEEGNTFLLCVMDEQGPIGCDAQACLPALLSWAECRGELACDPGPGFCAGTPVSQSCGEHCFGVTMRWARCGTDEIGSEVWSCECGYAETPLGTCEGANGIEGCCAEYLDEYAIP